MLYFVKVSMLLFYDNCSDCFLVGCFKMCSIILSEEIEVCEIFTNTNCFSMIGIISAEKKTQPVQVFLKTSNFLRLLLRLQHHLYRAKTIL